ncbi:ATP-binding protein [Catenulispora pinisilvae]|uniref:ATP-binding protein n=1 Tax=Catenulispora pinisilvae TaxID=2705253 RepID=UPI0018914321|nr:ATP-binding protein [Catenulispora pinisilvae]
MSYWSRSFPGLASCLAEVRQFTQMVLGDAPGAELVVLAVSELAGNAIVHTASGAPGGQFVVHLAAFADRWQVRVDDQGSPIEPHVVVGTSEENADWDSESGRGLAMVSAISRSWGVRGDRCARAVWAEIPYPVQAGAGIESVMSGGMLEALESVAEAMDAEESARLQEIDFPRQAAAEPVAEPVCEPAATPAPAPAPAPESGSGSRSGSASTTVQPVQPGRWRGTVPTDPARAERIRQRASQAAFMRSLIEIAHAEAIGPRPLPFWPPFPNPLALQGASANSEG